MMQPNAKRTTKQKLNKSVNLKDVWIMKHNDKSDYNWTLKRKTDTHIYVGIYKILYKQGTTRA